MSRHRNVRSMNYKDEYDGYDDVYGHSVEDDSCISPSDADQWLYDRNRGTQHGIDSYLDANKDIPEEDETVDDLPRRDSINLPELSSLDKARLASCLEGIRNVIGDTVPEKIISEIIIKHNFDLTTSLDAVLNSSDAGQRRSSIDTDQVPPPVAKFTISPPQQQSTEATIVKPIGTAVAVKGFHAPTITYDQLRIGTTSGTTGGTITGTIGGTTSGTTTGTIGGTITGTTGGTMTRTTTGTIGGTTTSSIISGTTGGIITGTTGGTSSGIISGTTTGTTSVTTTGTTGGTIGGTIGSGLTAIGGAPPVLCITPRSQSPASGRNTPKFLEVNGKTTTTADIIGNTNSGRSTPLNQANDSEVPNQDEQLSSKSVSKKETSKSDVLEQYAKDRGDSKEQLHMIVIGHVDAGKSTLMGHLLCSLGQVTQRTMHKYEQESKKLGKQSFVYAWVLDETGEERSRGITMDVGYSRFETPTKIVTLLDAPGHKDFIPKMIAGAGHADVALLVVDATRGEFETGFDQGGQTREHALLVRSLGVTQLLVAVNKLDTVSWSRDRFLDISSKLGGFLRQAGFREPDVRFAPCSGLTGENLVRGPEEPALLEWYKGPTLIEHIDNFKTPARPISKPFRMSISDIFKGQGSGLCASGRVETGCLNTGDRILVCPSREQAVVKSIAGDDVSRSVAFAGDEISVVLSGVDLQNVSVGYVLSDPVEVVPIASRFECRIVVFNVKVPITKGFPVVLHLQSLIEPVTITKLIAQLYKSTGETVKRRPRCLGNNSSALVEIRAARPICLERYQDVKELGRIMLRVEGVTIAAGLIVELFKE